MKIAKDGYRFILPALLAACALAGFKLWPAAASLLFLAAAIGFFFRDPERTPPDDPGAIVAPADGKIVEIANERRYNGGHRQAMRLSIFLSLFDVHVNRSPLGGKVRSVDYRRGKFVAAFKAEASELNEQNILVIASDRGEVVVKQIAGLLARRIVCWKRPGEVVGLGERIGLIRFGSRVDLILPPDAKPCVSVGQKVKAGETVIARLEVAEKQPSLRQG